MKKICILMTTLLLILSMFVPAAAAGNNTSLLVDDADLLSSSQEAAVLKDLNEVSEEWDIDVVIATVDQSFDGDDIDYYSVAFYSNGQYHSDGILLLISTYGDCRITPWGDAVKSFTDEGCAYILEHMIDDLGDDNYKNAFDYYVEQCDAFMKQAESGEPYGEGNLPKEPMNVLKAVLISLVVGIVLAFIVTGIMRSKLKSVRAQAAADNYVAAGSLNITQKQDLFLYRNVVRTPKPTSNSGGSGHSGRVSTGGRTPGARGKFK